MNDLDIKKMLLEGLMKQMDESDGKKFKKPAVAVVIEKHTEMPTDGTDEDPLAEALGDPSEDEDDEDAKSHIQKLGARLAKGK